MNDYLNALKNYQGQIDADGVYVGVPREELERAIEEIERLRDAKRDYDRALNYVRQSGVPETRAELLSQAMEVLCTRLRKEIMIQSGEISQLRERLDLANHLRKQYESGQVVFSPPKDTGATCEHGNGMNDYCEPCGRINSDG